MKKLLAIICLTAGIFSAHASEISLRPLKDVVPESKCIFSGKVLKVDIKKLDNGRSIELLVSPMNSIRGEIPASSKIPLTYSEKIPAVLDKSGKVVGWLSPIFSGSGKEFSIKKGETWIFLLSSEKATKLLRVEPISNEKNIKKIIQKKF